MKKIISVFIAVLLVISLGIPEVFMGNNILPTTVEAASPKLNKSYTYLNVGETVKLNVKNTKGKVTWSSADKAIATVKNGVVKAKSEGKVTITATVNNKNYYCDIIVFAIALNYETTDLSKGQRLELKLAGIPSREVKWKSSNKKIVTVDKNGKIKGIKAGDAIVEAIYKDKTYTCNVTVLGKEILIFSNDDIDLYFYSASVSPIDKQLYDKSDAPDEDFNNVGIKLRVRNKTDRTISISVDSPRLNHYPVDESLGSVTCLPNSIETLGAGGFIDPFSVNIDSFKKINKISGDISYTVGRDHFKEHFSAKLK